MFHSFKTLDFNHFRFPSCFHCWPLSLGRLARVLVATPTQPPRRLFRVVSVSASVDRRFRLPRPLQWVGEARVVFPFGEFGLDLVLTVSVEVEVDGNASEVAADSVTVAEVDSPDPAGVETGNTPWKGFYKFLLNMQLEKLQLVGF